MGIPFKLYEGKEANLPAELTAGGIYFCEDSGNVFIDVDIDGTLTRVHLGKKYIDDQLKDIKEFIENQGSGIEIGSEPPTKESANVWIDTDDEDEEGVEYLGVVTSINGKGGDINITASDIDAAEKTHAAQHAWSGSDPITPAAIGAAKDIDTMMIRHDNIDGKSITELSAGIYRLLGQNYPWKPDWCSGWGTLEVKRLPNADWGTAYLTDGINKRYAEASIDWHTGAVRWDEFATTDYALPRDGSAEMTGTLNIKGNTHTTQVIQFNGGSTLRNIQDSYNYTDVELTPNNKVAFNAMVDGAWNQYELHHTGNKPSGHYTGNGSARTHATGGIGSAIMLWNDLSWGVVTTECGIFVDANGTSFETLYQAKFESGVLTLSADSKFNTNPYVYHYQVL